MTQDELFMQRALELAKLGTGYVSPNPRVGCVIVHENRIIGEGWHKAFGSAHAEVNAINSVENESLLEESCLYVTLEPCGHTGKTPPCADLLISKRIKKIVVAIKDPNPLVAGRGIQKLRSAGIEVMIGVLLEEAEELNKRFFTSVEKQRPFIILKWAQTNDGFIAPLNRDRKWITNEYSRQLVHKWRTEEDAVMIGGETALYDNPVLNVRDYVGRNPVRIIIDRKQKLSPDLNVFNGQQKTISYNLSKDGVHERVIFVKISEEHFLADVISDLTRKGIQSIIIEGGAKLHNLFIAANLWDEARIFYSPIQFENGIEAPIVKGKIISRQKIKDDFLEIRRNNTI